MELKDLINALPLLLSIGAFLIGLGNFWYSKKKFETTLPVLQTSLNLKRATSYGFLDTFFVVGFKNLSGQVSISEVRFSIGMVIPTSRPWPFKAEKLIFFHEDQDLKINHIAPLETHECNLVEQHTSIENQLAFEEPSLIKEVGQGLGRFHSLSIKLPPLKLRLQVKYRPSISGASLKTISKSYTLWARNEFPKEHEIGWFIEEAN